MEILPGAARASSDKSFPGASQAKHPRNSHEHGSFLNELFFFSSPLFSSNKNNPTWSNFVRDFKQKPGGTSQDRLQFLSPRLGSEVYTQFSHTGCDAAHWTGVYAPFSPLSFFFFLRIKAWIHCTEDNQWITKKKKNQKKNLHPARLSFVWLRWLKATR